MNSIEKIKKFAKRRLKNLGSFFYNSKKLVVGYTLTLSTLMFLLDGTSNTLSIIYSLLWSLSIIFTFTSISFLLGNSIRTAYRFIKFKINSKGVINKEIKQTHVESNEKYDNNYNMALLKNVYKNDPKSLKKLLKKHKNVEIR